MFKFLSKNQISKMPKVPGVYCFKKGKEILYIGKAVNLRERVKNHFQQPTYRDNLFINQVSKIGYIKTGSEFAEPSAHLTSHPASQGSIIEALILEANLIKKYQPKYNVAWRDDKNYFYVGITKEDYPRVFWTHQTKLKPKTYNLKPIYIGPFVDGKSLKATLKLLRKVFPFRSCRVLPKRPCLWYHLNLCPAPCLFKERVKNECQRNAKNLMKFFQKGKIRVFKDLKKEMKLASKKQEFEEAAKIRDQIEALEKVLAHSKIFLEPTYKKIEEGLKKLLKIEKRISRIEAYDVSNIQGQMATGSMVTFINGKPDKNFYRRFKIKIAGKPNDVAMIEEVLSRRLKHLEWGLPDLILIDGGKAQLNASVKILNQHKSAKSAAISVISLAKKKNELFIEEQKKPILLKSLPREIFNLILQLRDEAHRFAISYHKKLREKAMFELEN
jgi:excinuclease ABC subunit C